MSIYTLLKDAIETELCNLDKLTPGTKEHSAAVEDVVRLINVQLEYDKAATSEEQAEKQMRDERHARWTKSGIDIALGAANVGVTILGIVLMLTFEEKGSITSKTGAKILGWIGRK